MKIHKFCLKINKEFPPGNVFLTFLSGVLLTLAFPKYNYSFLAWIALIPLLISLEEKPFNKAFFLGWITGVVHFMSLLHWVTIPMTQYGNLPIATSIFILVLLSFYLGLYVGIFSGALSFFKFRYLDKPMTVAPVIWVLLEYIRTYLFTGFPWELLGYSQYQNLILIQISDITGVYGVSFVIVLANIALYRLVKWAGLKYRPFPFRYTLFTLGTLIAVACYGNFRQGEILNLNKNSPHLQVSLIQGNIDQEQKWEPSFLYETLLIYQKLTLEAAKDHPDLIVWPETAVPCYFAPKLSYGPFLLNLAHKIKTPIIFGSLAYESRNRGSNIFKYFNSAFLASPRKEVFARYDKMHLVPFGEYVPLRPLLPFVEKLVVGIGDFSPGHNYTLFSIPQAKFGTLICYEVIFPNLSWRYSESGADFLVNITNDAWYGRSGAPYQHFSMAVFRAVENRTALVRVANSGVSGIIEPTGQIQAETPIFVRTFLKGVIPIDPEQTFYSQYGDIGVAFCGMIILILIIFG